jgi:hypothetical protein
MGRTASKVEHKWGSTVYDTIGIAYYCQYFYDNLTDFADAFKDAKSCGVDVSGNLDNFRIEIKTRKTLDDYLRWESVQSAMEDEE